VAKVGGASLRELNEFNRFHARYQPNIERHPTCKALTAALEAMESVPHGSLIEPG
jgi:DNA integrity scanning protein DisA with diadenylate cyclase activity